MGSGNPVYAQFKARCNGDGSYDVSYTPPTAGVLTVDILHKRHHIEGSPFRCARAGGHTLSHLSSDICPCVLREGLCGLVWLFFS